MTNNNLNTHHILTLLIVLCGLLTISSVSAKTPSKLNLTDTITQLSCDKQVVVLGELPTHGESLGFQAKADITQQLIERCHFKALFFEAPLYDFIGFQQAAVEKSAEQVQLDRAIGGFWLTRELKAWREWLFAQATTKNLILAGLDDQISASSEYARTTLPRIVASAFTQQNDAKCQQAIERNISWRYDDEHQFDQLEKNLLQQCTQQAAYQLSNNLNVDIIDKKMAENLANLYARNNKMSVALSRDEVMYQNFKWQHERLPIGTKVIIWTATVHAARQQGELKRKPLGAWLAEQWHDDMIAIGFTAYSGKSSMAGGPIKSIAVAPENALESLVTKPRTDWKFLTASELREIGSVSSRLYGRFTTADWSSKFDGVVIFRKEKAPAFKHK